jgi:aspartate 1-decarboxylase
MRTYLAGKLHGIVVTHIALDYHGSVTISEGLLELAGMQPYEQVTVCNEANGNRWGTYILATEHDGVFEVNGPGARLAEVGDRCVVLTYSAGDVFSGASVVTFEHDVCTNTVGSTFRYEPHPILN